MTASCTLPPKDFWKFGPLIWCQRTPSANNTRSKHQLGKLRQRSNLFRWIENDLIYRNLIWRNTKESIASEYTVPDYIEEVVYVDFSPIEALLHKRKNTHISVPF